MNFKRAMRKHYVFTLPRLLVNYLRKDAGQKRFCSKACANGKPWKVLFFGTDEFSVESLKKLTENVPHLVQKIEVVTTAKKSAVWNFAQANAMPVYQWSTLSNDVPNKQFDVGIVASFGHLIPDKIISAFPWGIINVHASLLPRWRGAAPVVHAILNGDKITGVTIMKIEAKHFDTGKILLQKSCPLPDDITAKQLTTQLAKLGAELLIDCLHNPECLRQGYSQDATKATRAPKIRAEMSRLDWLKQVSCIDRQFRAVGEYNKLYTWWNGKVVKLDQMVTNELLHKLKIEQLHHKRTNVPSCPGDVYIHNKRNIVTIRCQDDWVGFHRITIQGYKSMTALDFHNGFLSKVSKTDWRFTDEIQKDVLRENLPKV